jgi:hypothetical protein
MARDKSKNLNQTFSSLNPSKYHKEFTHAKYFPGLALGMDSMERSFINFCSRKRKTRESRDIL